MKKIVPGVVLRGAKAGKRKYNRRKEPKLSEKMVKTKELIQEGYALKKAMELAGYAPSTIEHNASLYMDKLDLNELKYGIKISTALSSIKALKKLDEKMDTAVKDQDQIRAADSVLKAGKIHLQTESVPPKIIFRAQTINMEMINQLKTKPEFQDNIIDIEPQESE
jgi:hypothetical protein